MTERRSHAPASTLPTALATGVRTLGANPLRTSLSTLGIIIGVAALVAVLSVGDGMEAYARREISRTTDVQSMSIVPQLNRMENGIAIPRADVITFTAEDAVALDARAGDAEVTLLQQGGAAVMHDAVATAAMVAATLPASAIVYDQTLMAGRFLIDSDVRDSAAVAVVNHALASQLASADARTLLGDTLLVNGVPLRVVGVLAPAEDSGGSAALAVPLTVGARVLSATAIARPPIMVLKAANVEDMGPLRASVEAWLGERYGDWEPRLTIGTSEARLAQVQQGMLIFKLFMGAITGISLVVGGIGILNELLAAVAERTREIGIRRAVGARARDVLLQFLAESVAITSAGSALGAALGLTAAFSITALIRARAEGARIEAAFTWETLAFAMVAAIVIGVVFGLYPALRASRLAPIDAIRHE
jgi:putative ABC transport system permease protein